MARKKNKSWVRVNFSHADALYMECEGLGTLNILQVTIRSAKNSIPEAAVTVPVGRLGRDGTTYTGFHEIAKQLKRGTKIKVWCRPKGEWDVFGTEWTGDARVIFEGRYAGTLVRRAKGSLTVGLQLVHWLSDMQAGSMLSQDIHFASAADLRDPAMLIRGSGAKSPSSSLSALAGTTTLQTLVRDDVASAIKTLLCIVANTDRVVLKSTDTAGVVRPGRNDLAIDALLRLEGPAEDCDTDYKYARAIPFKPAFNAIGNLPLSVAGHLNRAPLASLGSTTFWDALIRSYCPSLGLCVVPLVSRALIIPDCPTIDVDSLGDVPSLKYYKRLTPNDIYDMQTSIVGLRMVRGVAVFGRYTSDFGAAIGESGAPGPSPPPTPRLCGTFQATAEELQFGSMLHLNAPQWLNDLSFGDPRTLMALPSGGGIPTAASPSRPALTATVPGGDTPRVAARTGGALADEYAKSLFVNQTLSSSTLRFTSKLRFDICPGAMLEISPIAETPSGVSTDELATGYWGQVSEVTIHVSRDPASCGTEIQLGWVRTDAERELPDLTLSEHPFYGDKVTLNAPLVTDPDDAWAFADEEDDEE